ncbi:hypothetical protein CEE37_08375 [candidate division LCP-89 bacterium B3_LCP]|uniref:PNPLA domain-containing protein n=1 Tax=candidate division LCP-89 bacterium B3_LCP TaxID=2012998 RepID=A0A532UZK4_UNCL8|nr:MAG: hypothetical protein CEE37_08375 [candidate division LCP-89 bacterium B3_LCP]
MIRTLVALLAASTLFISPVQGQDNPTSIVQDEAYSSEGNFSDKHSITIQVNPGVTLALSGGGTRGIAHIGALKALQDADIPINGIAGTSIGAVIGGFYSSGYTLAEIESMVHEIDWNTIFLDTPQQKSLPLSRKSTQSHAILEILFEGTQPFIPSALATGQKLSRLLVEKFNRAPYRPEPDFHHLKIPFTAVCTDLGSGERILFKSGDLSEAVFASMSLPLLISPVEYKDRYLIDGGVAENIPVHAASELGSFVIAVDVTMPPTLGEAPFEPWEIANQVTGLMAQEQNNKLLEAADIAIKLLPDSLTNFTFDDPYLYIDMGYQAMMKAVPAIKEHIKQRLLMEVTGSNPISKIIIEQNGLSIESTFELAAESYLKNEELPKLEDIQSDLIKLQAQPEIHHAWAQIRNDTLTYFLKSNPIVKDIEITGVTQLPVGELIKSLTGVSAISSNLRLSDIDSEAVLRAYRDIDNPLAVISKTQIDESGTLTITVDEGILNDIRIEGTHHSSSGRILRDFKLKSGEPLNLSDLIIGIDELYGSNLFILVRATLVNGIVTIKVRERPSPRLRLGAGLDSDNNGRGLLELYHESVPFIGGSVSAWIKYAEFHERYELTYRNLAILRTYLEASGSLLSSRTEYHYYNQKGQRTGLYHFERLGGTAYFGQQFRTWGRIIIGARGERIRSDHLSSSPELDLRRFFLRAEYDTRDQFEFPTSGLSYNFLLESAPSALGGDISFHRVHLELTRAIPITHRFTFIGKLRGGICDQATPFSEWFRLGGEESFVGLHQDEVSGRQLVSLRAELREDLISKFLADAYLSILADIGNIWEDLESDVNSGDFKQSFGFKFSLDTFIGPISLTYGHLFAHNNLEDRDMIYFNIGHRF